MAHDLNPSNSIRYMMRFCKRFGSALLQHRLRAAHGFASPLLSWLRDAIEVLDSRVAEITEDIHKRHTRDLCNSLVFNAPTWDLYHALIAIDRRESRFGSAHYKHHASMLLSAAAAAVGDLELYQKKSEGLDYEQLPCFPFCNPIGAAVATGKLEIIKSIIRKSEEHFEHLSRTAVAHGSRAVFGRQILSACSVAIVAKQHAAGRMILAYLSLPINACFLSHYKVEKLFMFCVDQACVELSKDVLQLLPGSLKAFVDQFTLYLFKKGDGSVLVSLIREGVVSPNICKKNRTTTTTPLMMALKSRRLDLAKLLLLNGAQIDAVIDQEQGVTALWHAANCGNEEDVKLLLDHGADMESQPGWRSPMQVAKERGHQNIVKLLLAARGE
jgi:hypothetical protein